MSKFWNLVIRKCIAVIAQSV